MKKWSLSRIGLTKHSPNKENTLKLIEYLTGENAQKLYINTSHEYPVNPLVEPSNIMGDF